mmetsp:Transcript_4487/g.13595  ORF Transcript_4487/g.13595 Transcript_4487/m.13595 type:complete len:253 (+) Transcript_4487:114-872(+)
MHLEAAFCALVACSPLISVSVSSLDLSILFSSITALLRCTKSSMSAYICDESALVNTEAACTWDSGSASAIFLAVAPQAFCLLAFLTVAGLESVRSSAMRTLDPMLRLLLYAAFSISSAEGTPVAADEGSPRRSLSGGSPCCFCAAAADCAWACLGVLRDLAQTPDPLLLFLREDEDFSAIPLSFLIALISSCTSLSKISSRALVSGFGCVRCLAAVRLVDWPHPPCVSISSLKVGGVGCGVTRCPAGSGVG